MTFCRNLFCKAFLSLVICTCILVYHECCGGTLRYSINSYLHFLLKGSTKCVYEIQYVLWFEHLIRLKIELILLHKYISVWSSLNPCTAAVLSLSYPVLWVNYWICNGSWRGLLEVLAALQPDLPRDQGEHGPLQGLHARPRQANHTTSAIWSSSLNGLSREISWVHCNTVNRYWQA